MISEILGVSVDFGADCIIMKVFRLIPKGKLSSEVDAVKKTAIIISALILAVVMAGCSGTQTNSTALSAPSVNTELLKD